MTRPLPRAVILLGLLVFVAARLVLVVRAPTQLYQPEEYVNLRLAASLLGEDGAWGGLPRPVFPPLAMGSQVDVPLLDAFQYQDFDGGTLAASIVLVPVAWLLGLGVASVKAGALLWSLLILLLWLEVLGEIGGPAGAAWGAAAFAAAPAPWLVLSSIHWGNHAESAWGPPMILLAGLAARRSAGWQRGVALTVLGGVVGGAVWFSQLNLLPGGMAGLGSLFVARTRWRELPLVGLGLAVGLAPRALRSGPAALLHFGAQGVGPGDLIGALSGGQVTVPELRTAYASQPSLATWSIAGLGSQGTAPGVERWLRGVLLVALGAASLGALRGARARGLVSAVLLVIIATWALQPALLLASFELFPRRTANLYPLFCAAIALGCLAAARWRTWAGLTLLLAWAAPNLWGQGVLLSRADPTDAPMAPWAWYSPPARDVWARVPGGLPVVDPDLVAAVEGTLSALYSAPGPQAKELSAGFFQAFGQQMTALDRARLRCEAPRGAPSPGPLASWGFGVGLRLRCRDQAPDPALCDAASQGDACLDGLRGSPRPAADGATLPR